MKFGFTGTSVTKPSTPTRSRASASISTARSISASVCAGVSRKRRMARPLGTAGNSTKFTTMPCSSMTCATSRAFFSVPIITDKNATQLIRELRLVRAKQLLEQGAGNATEVAFMVGFNTPAYFAKCFMDQYGVTPGEVRKASVISPR